ncbi:MAG TPA: amidohydrolase family protein [Caulobacteraceae bacterium]|nr:amidohydrolase family protein [Caulobacteraceae bacterium]
MTASLVIRNVEIEGRAGLDVRLEAGRVVAFGERLPRCADEIEGRGGALIPGLADHHIHLFALAAEASSIRLAGLTTPAQLRDRIAVAAAAAPAGAWLRATGYHERMAGELTRLELDALAPRHKLRLQHQTGSLWMLNSAALAAIGAEAGPPSVERGADGAPTGRIWRGDGWMREQLGPEPPPLAPIGRQLAAYGITAVTDASVTTDAAAAQALAVAHRAGDLPQRLTLMSGGALGAPADGAFAVGPVKVLLDDHALPDFNDFTNRIAKARVWGRAVAVHCVTAAELALTLAAFGAAGAQAGDRIEHGGVIPAEAIPQIRALGLTVVTQPAFVRERGDRYLAEVDPAEQPDLYRLASLRAAGIPVASSSDAPYATPDPWLGIAAAADRTTVGGRPLGLGERVAAAEALALYLGPASDPGGGARRVEVGVPADLCLLATPLAEALGAPSADAVRATLIDGAVVHDAETHTPQTR